MKNPETLLSQRKLDVPEGKEEKVDDKELPSKRASVVAVTKNLEERTAGTQGRGYPGELNNAELQACLKFREELKKRDPAYREIVYAYGPVEDEAFALCRFLRAQKFQVEKVFQMMDNNNVVGLWNNARKHDFYQDLEKEFGCPQAVLMTQIPIIVSGLGKNGASVIYFRAGGISVDGVECVANMGDLVPFVGFVQLKRPRFHQGSMQSAILLSGDYQSNVHDQCTAVLQHGMERHQNVLGETHCSKNGLLLEARCRHKGSTSKY